MLDLALWLIAAWLGADALMCLDGVDGDGIFVEAAAAWRAF